jgi:hypothetical protein
VKRQIEGLHKADQSSAGVFPNVLFLVRIEHARYRWHPQRPYYALQFAVLEPKALALSPSRTHWALTSFGRRKTMENAARGVATVQNDRAACHSDPVQPAETPVAPPRGTDFRLPSSGE